MKRVRRKKTIGINQQCLTKKEDENDPFSIIPLDLTVEILFEHLLSLLSGGRWCVSDRPDGQVWWLSRGGLICDGPRFLFGLCSPGWASTSWTGPSELLGLDARRVPYPTLLKIPTKSVSSLDFVSKHWLSLIRGKDFINMYLARSSARLLATVFSTNVEEQFLQTCSQGQPSHKFLRYDSSEQFDDLKIIFDYSTTSGSLQLVWVIPRMLAPLRKHHQNMLSKGMWKNLCRDRSRTDASSSSAETNNDQNDAMVMMTSKILTCIQQREKKIPNLDQHIKVKAVTLIYSLGMKDVFTTCTYGWIQSNISSE
ncbi:hypothetical protein Bca4012_062643 [Brassica carinata]